MQEIKSDIIEEDNNLFDIVQLWKLFMKNWKWFPVSILTCLFIAAIYLWFTPTTVSVLGKMELFNNSKGRSSSLSAGLAMLNSLPFGLSSNLGGGSIGIDAEKEILMSNTLVCNVVKDLGLFTEYRLSRWGRKSLLYQNNPITVSLDSVHVQWFDDELPLTFHQIQLIVSKGSSGYKVKTKLVENKEKTQLPTQTFASLPATLKTEVGTLTITENILPIKQAESFERNYTLEVTITPPSKSADSFIARLSAEPPTRAITSILSITLQDQNLMRGIDFINNLVEAYNQRANDQKNEEARKTDEFVNARLAKIDVELGTSDDAWENSKKQYQITTPEVDAQEALTKRGQYEARLVEIGTKLQLHDYLSDYVSDPNNMFELIPSGMIGGGLEGQANSSTSGTTSFIAQHNQLVNQRKDLLKSVSEMSPQVLRLTKSIEELHPTLVLALKRDREQLVMQKNTLDREYARYTSRIGSAPQMERVFTEIGRQREIKQAVYLLLLQKREETAMDLVNITDKGRLIDKITSVDGSSKPQKKRVLALAFFLGALFPMGILYLFQILKVKIDTREELEAITQLPILSEIPHTDSEEAIRSLRTKLLLQLKTGQNIILVASQNDGDGKTFIAQHLTDSLTAIGKKSLYVNGDIRKSNSQSSTANSQFSILNSQFSQGHPTDILASEEFALQIAQAKATKDFVIIDSPALGKYVDALQLAQFADATLYVAKLGATLKSNIKALNHETRLPEAMLVIN